jgi:hypothetical protein
MTIKNLAVFQALESLAAKSRQVRISREMLEERMQGLESEKLAALQVIEKELSNDEIELLLSMRRIEDYKTMIELERAPNGRLAIHVQEQLRGLDIRELDPDRCDVEI